MNIEDLAEQAVGLLVGRLREIAAYANDRVADSVVDALVERIELQLAGDEFGNAALVRVRERPDDARRVQALKSVVAGAADDDPEFVQDLRVGVSRAHQAVPAGPPFAATTSVAVGKAKRTNIALGQMKITNSPQVRISFGLGGFLILALALAAFRYSDRQAVDNPVDRLAGEWHGEDGTEDYSEMRIRSDGSIGMNIGDLACTGTVSTHDATYQFDVNCGILTTTGDGSFNSDGTLAVSFTGFTNEGDGAGEYIFVKR